jgi:hypothetical protein
MTELWYWYIYAPLEEVLSWGTFLAFLWAIWGLRNE